MHVVELKDLFHEEGWIYYMRKYTATAVLDIPEGTLQTPISFSIETNPFGLKTIELEINSTFNYPILPVKKALVDFILAEDKEGRLP